MNVANLDGNKEKHHLLAYDMPVGRQLIQK